MSLTDAIINGMLSKGVLMAANGAITPSHDNIPFEGTQDAVRKMLGSLPVDIKKVDSEDQVGYSNSNKAIYLKTGDKAVGFHEAGHALQHKDMPRLSELGMNISRNGPNILGVLAAAGVATGNETINNIAYRSPEILALMKLPELALEYDASSRAKHYLRENDPELLKQVSPKLNKALMSHILGGMSTPASLAAARSAYSMNKQAGVVGWAAKGLAKGVLKGGKLVVDSGKEVANNLGKIHRAKGLKEKGKVLWKSNVGNLPKDAKLGTKAMHYGGAAATASVPAFALKDAYDNRHDPKKAISRFAGGMASMLSPGFIGSTLVDEGVNYGVSRLLGK